MGRVVEGTRVARHQANHKVDIRCYVGRIGWGGRGYSAHNVSIIERQGCSRNIDPPNDPVGAGIVAECKHCGANGRGNQRKFV